MSSSQVLDVRGASAHERLHWKVMDVCDATGDFISWWGFPAIEGRVWALLAMSRHPLSQAEVARRLGVSRALVSGAVAALREHGLVRPLSESRQAPYVAVMDILPIIAEVMRRREWMLVERARTSLDAALAAAKWVEELDEQPAYDVERLKAILSLTEMAQGFLRVLMGLRVPQGVEGFKTWIGWVSRLTSRLKEFGSRAGLA